MSSYGNVPIDEYSKQSLGNSSNSNSQEGSEFFSDSASPIKPQDANSSFLEASKSQDPNSQKTSTSISSSVSSSSNTCNKLNDCL
jgi:hypothetical protein